MKPYYPSIAAHTFIKHSVGVVVQNYLPSIAAHSWPVISTTTPTPSSMPATSPSSQVDDLIAALSNPQDLSNDALYEAAANAQAAMSLWQDEYFKINRQIAVEDHQYRKNDPRKTVNSNRERQLRSATLNNEQIDPLESHELPQKRGRRPANNTVAAAEEPGPKRLRSTTLDNVGDEPEKPTKPGERVLEELNIAMEKGTVAPEGTHKRVRKPCKIFQGGDEPTLLVDNDSTDKPITSKMRGRKPTYDAVPAPSEPTTKRLRSATPAIAPARRITARAKTPAPVVKVEEEAKPAGKDPKRSEAMRAVWARRQTEGTNGRHGGAPKEGKKTKTAKEK